MMSRALVLLLLCLWPGGCSRDQPPTVAGDPYAALDGRELAALLDELGTLGAEGGTEREPPPELDRPYVRQADAIAAARATLVADPAARQAREQLARLYAAAGRNDLARREYAVLLRADPRNAMLHLHYASQLWYERTDAVAALRHARAAAALALPPSAEVERAFLLGAIAEMRGEVVAAERFFARVKELDPRQVEATYRLGSLARDRGDAGVAEQRFREVLVSDPVHVRALFALGTLLVQRGQRAEGDGLLLRHARLRRIEALGYLGEREAFQCIVLGNHAALAGEFADALAEFGRALALEPDNADARSYRAAVLLDVGRVDEALREFKQVLARDPRHAHALTALAAFHLGAGSEPERDAARGVDLARRAVAASGERDARALALLARGLARAGEREAALVAIDKACALEPLRADWQTLRSAIADGQELPR